MLKSTEQEGTTTVGTPITDQVPQLRPETLELPSTSTLDPAPRSSQSNSNNELADLAIALPIESSKAAEELSVSMLKILEPPLAGVRGQIKELIGKQNKISVDLLAEKFKLDNVEMARINKMMQDVGVYRDKLIKIKKQMQTIYQRNKTLKRRVDNIYACKQKEFQRKLQKQQQEESLIPSRQSIAPKKEVSNFK